MKGRIYEALDNRAVATDCYKQALHCDVYSYQAFEALVQNQMLSAAEGSIEMYWHKFYIKIKIIIIHIIWIEKELLESLPFGEQCTEAEAEFLQLLYESKLKKYQEPNTKQPLATCSVMGVLVTDRLLGNLDMEITEAERLYYNCDYHKCFSLTER